MLERARKEKNIYIIARSVMMLRGVGVDCQLTDSEKSEVILKLEKARKSQGMLGLEPGYELARWLMICRFLMPESQIRPSKDDIVLIQEACDSYCRDRIFKQVASLVHMSQILQIPIKINHLPKKKRRLIKKIAATLR